MSGVGQRPAAATSATASRGDMPTTGGASRGGAYASPGTNEPVMPVPVDTPKFKGIAGAGAAWCAGKTGPLAGPQPGLSRSLRRAHGLCVTAGHLG